jgi:hypothetical protein
MNTTNSTRTRGRFLAAGLTALVVAATGLVSPSAHAGQPIPDVGLAATPATIDIAELVTARKVRLSQDRVDRAWLYLY